MFRRPQRLRFAYRPDGTRDSASSALLTVSVAFDSRWRAVPREAELLALRWGDVDWERGAIRVRRTLQRAAGGYTFVEPKTASGRRTIPLRVSAMTALRRHWVTQAAERLTVGAAWQDGGLVFATETGTPVDAWNLLRRSHYPLLARAGLPRIRFHDLRHTAATLLLEAGLHPRVSPSGSGMRRRASS
jgi:integrase